MTRWRLVFDKLFGKYLLATNTICSSVLMAAGDTIEQKIRNMMDENKLAHNWQRTNNMFIVGFALGPVQHIFYKLIDERYPCNSLKSVLKKVVIEQTVASPMYIILFFMFCAIVEKQQLRQCGKELKDKFLHIYTIDCLVWPPSQILNFYFLGPQFRMLYVNFANMIYDVLLSYVKYEDHQK